MQPQASTLPEPSAQPEANSQPIAQPANATACPKPEPQAAAADIEARSGAQTVREVLNAKINPFVSAGLRQIFRDPANMYARPDFLAPGLPFRAYK